MSSIKRRTAKKSKRSDKWGSKAEWLAFILILIFIASAIAAILFSSIG